MTKDPKKLLLTLMIIAIFIALVAFAVGIFALSLKDRNIRRDIQSGTHRTPRPCQLLVRIRRLG